MKRRSFWHWLSDHGAPHWVWSRFVGSTWKPCARCGWRGIGRWKRASQHGGGQPSRYACTADHARDAWGLF